MFWVIFMVTVYLIRHCEAEGNVRGIFQGSTDLDITPLGAKQLEFLSKRFENIHIDRVYSSPLLRAYKTAQAVSAPKGLEVITDEDLREINGGVIEGMKLSDVFVHYPELEDKWGNEFQNFAPELGDNVRDVYERIWDSVTRIVRENDGKTVAIASHGGALRTLICRITEGDIEKINNVCWLDNTAVTKIVFNDDMSFSTCFVNDSSHVPPEYMPVAHKISSQGK